MSNNIPSTKTPFIDPRTGLVSREWYRYLAQVAVDTRSQSGQPSGQPSGASQTHTGNATLTFADLNASHFCTAAAILTLPEITQDMLDIGAKVLLHKNTTGTVGFLTGGTDLIVDADNISNTNTDTDLYIELIAMSLGVWGLGGRAGLWASV